MNMTLARMSLDRLRPARWIHYLVAVAFLAVIEAVALASLSTASLVSGGLSRLASLFPGAVATPPSDVTPWLALDLGALLLAVGLLVWVGVLLVLVRRSRWVRYLLIGYALVIVLELVTILALIFLSLWNPEGHSILYLNDGAIVWILNILVFGTLYWGLDADRQVAHATGQPVRTHFRFPQADLDKGAWGEWRPGIVDYLFLAFSTSTALSPTDTACLTRRAKVLMMGQSLISLAVIIMIVARAVNII